MNDVPNWVWQGIATNLAADGLVGASWLAWKYREALLKRLRRSRPAMVVPLPSLELAANLMPVGSQNTAMWNVEAPTPSLARRLEELASWYLHVS